MMKKYLFPILIIMICLLLAACGGNDNGGSIDAEKDVIPTKSTEAEESEPSADEETTAEYAQIGEAVAADNYVVADDEFLKIVVVNSGVYEYNSEWIGYNLLLTNKTDRSLYFTAYAVPSEEYDFADPNNNTCLLGGEQTKTEFGAIIYENKTDVPAFMAIKGLTDTADVKDVSGYIRVSYNDDENNNPLGYYPYHFE